MFLQITERYCFIYGDCRKDARLLVIFLLIPSASVYNIGKNQLKICSPIWFLLVAKVNKTNTQKLKIQMGRNVSRNITRLIKVKNEWQLPP